MDTWQEEGMERELAPESPAFPMRPSATGLPAD